MKLLNAPLTTFRLVGYAEVVLEAGEDPSNDPLTTFRCQCLVQRRFVLAILILRKGSQRECELGTTGDRTYVLVEP